MYFMTPRHWSSYLLRWHAKMKDLNWLMTSSPSRVSTVQTNAKSEFHRRDMSSKYQEAIGKLNDLQSNASVLNTARKNKGKLSHRNIPEATLFAERAGVTVDNINTLPIIHVSGTKGKGSVCAFCESILRKHGLKTGFYSSPHLVEVRERLRINGLPMKKEEFADSFFEVYDKLEATKKDHGDAMPAYFRFLTIMAFHVFLKEKVDVALIEVGIGGEYDCTNIIRQPAVTGITSLGMDHTFLLGDSLSQIAWHKAGICKPGKPVYTVPQPKEAMEVVQERAKEIGAPLYCTVSLEKNHFGDHSIQLGLAGEHQRVNASLAIHLCRSFLETHKADHFQAVKQNLPSTAKRIKLDDKSQDESVAEDLGIPLAEPFVLPESFITGLRECYWAGRNQSVRHGRVTYYIDGAHTIRSIEACRKWFLEETEKEIEDVGFNVAKILVFNSTGKRDSIALLKPLLECQFDGVVFCPNIVSDFDGKNSPDMTYKHSSINSAWERVQLLKQEFEGKVRSLVQSIPSSPPTHVADNDAIATHNAIITNNHHVNGDNLKGKPSLTAEVPPELPTVGAVPPKTVAVPSITDALQWAACAKDPHLSSPRREDPVPPEAAITADHVQVLVTGSIHLVGGVIKALNPDLVLHGD